MRAFVASDDPSLSFQLREELRRLGHDCPASQIVSLDLAVARLSSLADASRQAVPQPEAAAGAAPSAADGEPELLLVVLSPAPDQALAVLRDLRRRAQQARLFAVGPTTDSRLVLRALREGAHEYLDQAELKQELSAALERLKAEGGGRRGGRLIVLLGAGGGSGVSTLAVSLATVLADKAGGCLLLDLKPEAGDLASLLDLKPAYTLADVCRNVARLDRGLLEGSLVSHSSGVRLLAAPPRIADAVHVTAEGIRQVLSLAADLAPFVVADVDRSFRGESMQALLSADEVLLVVRLDFTSLRNARRILDHLEESGRGRDRTRVVVNRYGQSGELAAAEAEAALGVKIAHYVPDDPKTVNRANNNGVPVVQHHASAKVSRQITELAMSLVGKP